MRFLQPTLLLLAASSLLQGQIMAPVMVGGSPLPAGLKTGYDFSSADKAYGLSITDMSSNHVVTTSGVVPVIEDTSNPGLHTYGSQIGPFGMFRVPNGTWNWTGDMTVAFQFNLPASPTNFTGIVNAMNYNSPYTGWAIPLNGFGCAHKLSYTNNNAGWLCGAAAIDDGAWHVAVVRYSGTTLTFYLDGAVDATRTSVTAPSAWTGINTIGAQTDGSNIDWFNTSGVKVSGLLMWQRALTAAEVTRVSTTLVGYKDRHRAVVPTTLTYPPVITGVPSNGLALTPPMGWNTWNAFGESFNFTDAQLRAEALAIQSTGLQALGYNTFIIDGTNSLRDANGNFTIDVTEFPSGIAPVIAYVKSLGLKAGMYSGPGISSVGYGFNSGRHEVQDAAFFLSLGIDYLKYDIVPPIPYALGFGDSISHEAAYQLFATQIQATGRPIVLSSSSQANIHGNVTWGCASGFNLRRTGTDLQATWASMMAQLDVQVGLASGASVGCWNDPDMLQIGNGMGTEADKSQFAIWSILAAPLIMGHRVTAQSGTTLGILSNTDIIAVDQDALGVTGVRVSQVACGSFNCEVWVKQLTGTNTCAIALLNRDTAGAHNITATFATIAGVVAACGSGPYTTTRDLSAHSSLGTLTTSYTATSVPAMGTFIFKVAP